jgi:hypothetical protein
MADHADDELAASKTAGFNAGEKKTLEEYEQLGRFILYFPGPSAAES